MIKLISQHGIPGPWQKFGMMLSKDGAISNNIVHTIESRDTRESVLQLFDYKLENLANARNLLRDVVKEYDINGTWEKLNAALPKIDFKDIYEALTKDFGLHPFPAVLKSLKFNWEFMKKHGVRAFYEMTDEYLKKVEQVSRNAKRSFQNESDIGSIKQPYWLIHMDLVSIEVGMHCDVCRMSIAPILLMAEHY